MKIIENIKKINKKKILVIGDIMLDKYFFGKSTRISPEAPVPILLESKQKIVLGGAANVARNLVSANQDVTLMSVIGNDVNADIMLEELKNNNINADLIIEDETRCTTVKNRFIGQNNMQMFRLDEELSMPISENVTNKFLKKLEENISKFDLVIISDYNKGLLTLDNTPKFISIANKYNIKVLVDIKEPNYQKYANAYIIKPNLNELGQITKMPVDTDDDIIKAAIKLKDETNCNHVLVTRGASGMTLVSDNGYKNFECASREVYDVTGAGDTVISYLAVGVSNNFDLSDTINIANYAAGVKVSKMGTYAVKPTDIIEYIIDATNILDEEKIVTCDKLVEILKQYKDKKIVFTNGCFDIFHVGHLRYLKESAKYGDLLIVGVNSDSSVKRLKGEKRPIVNEKERMELLSALNFVSYVVSFDADTPYEIIKKIQPDIITKGGDYDPNTVVGKDIVEKKGGKVIICPLVDNKSTTNIVSKILEVYND